MLRYYQFDQDHYTETTSLDAAEWLQAEQPTPEEIAFLQNHFKLPKDYVTSVLDQQENSRHEGLHQKELEDPVLLLLQYPSANISPSGYQQYDVLPVALIVTKNCLITLTNTPLELFNTIKNTRYTDPQLTPREATILTFLWEVSVSFNKCLHILRGNTDNLESQLKVATENSQLYQLMDIQKSLVYFKMALEANLPVIISLYKTKLVLATSQTTSRIHDISVETRQALTSTEIQLQLVTQISATFSAIVSNNLNIIMKVLTSLTVILTIPSVIGALYGMNVKLPFADREDAFWLIAILTAALCWVCIRILKKKKLF